ncbi:MAG: hypothetical protein IJY69_05610 [Clostridia bacterium]|nr:hypothetical protein [Clostridia bacterium]
MNDDNRNGSYYEQLTGFKRAIPVILVAVAGFMAVCFMTSGTGWLGGICASVLLGLFSAGAYAIPLLLVSHAIFYAGDHFKGLTLSRSIFSSVTVLVVSCVEYAIVNWNDLVFAPVEFYRAQASGGFVGSVIGYGIATVLGNVGLIILAFAVIAIYITFFFTKGDGAFSRIVVACVGAIASVLAAIERWIKKMIASAKAAKEEKEQLEEEMRSSELLDDQFFAVDNGMKELKISELGIHEIKHDESLEKNPTFQSKFHPKSEAEPVSDTRSTEPKRSYVPTEVAPEEKRPVDLTYGFTEELMLTEPSVKEEEKAPEIQATPARRVPLGIDESADGVFTKDFDPFDFATSDKLSYKTSSRVKPKEQSTGISEYATPLSAITEEDMIRRKKELEAEKRQAEFEERKRKLLGDMHKGAATVEAAAESTGSPAKAEANDVGEVKTVTEAKPVTVNITEDKAPVDREKSVAYSITKERQSYAPSISDSMIMTFDKPDYVTDETADVAARVAEVVERNTPGYARSANKSYTYTKITMPEPNVEDTVASEAVHTVDAENVEAVYAPDETAPMEISSAVEEATAIEEAASVEAEEATATETFTESAPEARSIDAQYPVDAAPLEQSYSEYTDAVAAETQTPIANEAVSTAAPYVQENTSTEYDKPIEAISTEAVPHTEAPAAIHESVSTHSDDYGAGFEKIINIYSTSHEPEPDTEETFKPYEVPTVDYATIPKEPVEELKIERTLISPTPDTVTADLREQRDRKYTVIDEDMPLMTDTPDPVEESTEDSFGWAVGSETDTADTVENAPDPEVEDGGTVFDFGADNEDSSVEDEPAIPASDDGAFIFGDGDDTLILDGEESREESDEESLTFESNNGDGIFDIGDEGEDDSSVINGEEIPPEEQNPEIAKQREMFPFLDDPVIEDSITDLSDDDVIDGDDYEDLTATDDEPPFDTVPSPVVLPRASVVKDNLDWFSPVKETPAKEKEEKKEKKKPDFSSFKFPPIDLLGLDENRVDLGEREEIQENADKLIETLASFEVTASIKGVDRGPRITRYEVVPAKGVKVSRVLGLQDDIALNLAAESIRMEAPIPGKSAVGVEIPNKKASTVRLRELLDTEEFKSAKSKTTVCMGKDVAGQPIFADIAKMPHALIAGATGMGKSVCINSLMISMLFKARPDEVKFIMIDPKQVEFTMYNGIPHLLVPIVTDVKQAAGALQWAVEEMERRYSVLQDALVKNIDAYNEKVASDPSVGEPMHRIIIVIDEFAELIMQVKNPVESLVIRIAQKARAAGIHLIIGTQKPVKEVITGLIKSNIPTKMSCKVLSNRDSILIFDQAGAERLLDKGDMLVAFASAPKPQRVQCTYVNDTEVDAVMDYLKQFSDGNCYDESVIEGIKRETDRISKKNGGDDDDRDDEGSGEGYLNDRQFLEAVEVAVNSSKISTSLLQRKLSIGYGKAAKFIDIMYDMGIVGDSNGQKPRDVLISSDEWREKLARTMID